MRIAAGATLVVTLLAGARAARADCSDPFANPDEVVDFHLRMSPETFDQLVVDEPVDDGTCLQYPYHEVQFRCGDGEPWITIGARRKLGDQRGRDTDEKPPLKLDINRYVMGQRWPAALGDIGYRKLSMNQGQPDAPVGAGLTVLLSEHLAWRLMHREIPASSRSAYARLFVHHDGDSEPEYHGIYILVEDLDRTRLERRFGDGTGTLYKDTGGGGAPCDGVRQDDGPPNEALDRFEDWYAKDPDEYDGSWYDETDEAMHLEELIRQEAIREIWVNDDNIFTDPRNYYVFDPRVGKRHWLPWDLDAAFRVVGGYPPDEPLGHGKCSDIGARTRCNPEIRARYMAVACQLINGTMSAEHILAEIERVDALVRPLIPDEVDLVWGGAGPLDASQGLNYQAAYDHLQSFVPARIDSVREQIEAEGVPCPPGCPEGATEACDYLTCAGERTCERGFWSGCRTLDDGCTLGLPPGGGGGGDGGPGSGGDGGAPGGDGDGGPGDGDGDGGPGGGAAPDEVSSGCGCRVATHRQRDGELAAGLLIAIAAIGGAAGRRARRRAGRAEGRGEST
jgi:hypothetical protein